MLIQSDRWSKVKDSVSKLNPELIAILSVYFVQGILGLARLAISFFLKDELHLSPVEMSVILGIVSLPWIVKPLYGFISDGLPIFGYRRRPYLILSGILGAASWVSLATIVHTSWAATLAITLSSLSVALSDVIVDSLVVERARTESLTDAGFLQSLCWGAFSIGGLTTAYFSGLLLEYFSTRIIFWITAFFPLIVSTSAWLISETPVSKNDADENQTNWSTIKNQLGKLRQAVTQKAIWLPALFILLLHATPSSDASFFFFVTNELHFEPEFLGRVYLISNIAALIGIWIFQNFLKTVPFRIIFSWSIILSSIVGMTTLLLVTHTNRLLGIDDHWFSLGDNLILTVIGKIAFMPVMVLAARICPAGVEATLFALLMSVLNLGGIFSHQLEALITHLLGITETNFDALWLLVLIANFSKLLTLFFINWLPDADEQLTATNISTSTH
jgi:folate/biopterin transporter